MKLEGLSLVGRVRVQPSGVATNAVNPATGESLEPGYFWASAADVERAAAGAAAAFLEYSQWPARRRAGFLRRIADLIESNGAKIQERANLETALPLPRLKGETARTCGQLRLFAALLESGFWLDARIDHAEPGRLPAPKPDLRSMLVALGPVVVFGSSNFPLAFSVAGGDTASALAAGCPVIVKPHQGHLGTSELVGQLVRQAAAECGAPDGVFSMLYGPGREVGMALVRHPAVKAVGFTGSRAGGRALMAAAAARPEPIPVYAEMSSVNPVFLLPRILEQTAETLAAGLHGSVTLGAGQFCTNPGLVFLERGAAAETFLRKLESLMAAAAPATMLTPDICAAYRSGLARFTGIANVRLLAGGPAGGGNQAATALFATDPQTLLANPGLGDEVFGPSTLVVECASNAEMVAAAEKLEGQLTATVHGTAEEIIANGHLLGVLQTKAGRVLCNGFPTGVEVSHAMNHGGPFPATSDGRSTSVGTRAIARFARPVCYQNFPDAALPDELKESNPLGIPRLVDGSVRAVA